MEREEYNERRMPTMLRLAVAGLVNKIACSPLFLPPIRLRYTLNIAMGLVGITTETEI